MSKITAFVERLKIQGNTSRISNPYLKKTVAKNLEMYLESMLNIKGKRVLLIGEAPGYKGCKITGVPFTSGKVFENINHPVLLDLKNKINLEKVESENTATIVWNYLSKKNDTPLFWNSYPYHPHPKDNGNKNRAPTDEEIKYGVTFLHDLNEMFKPELIAGIGHSGVNCAKHAFPDKDIRYIRHPSFGGKAKFIEGMNEIIS